MYAALGVLLCLCGAAPAEADERPVAVILGIAASQGGEYVDTARSVADALSAELSKAEEFDVLFFDAENPTIKRALVEGRLEGEVLAHLGTPEGMRAVLAELGASFGVDISLESIRREPETVSVDLSVKLTGLADPDVHQFAASGVESVTLPYAESLTKAASSAGIETARAIRREIVSAMEFAGGASARDRLQALEASARTKLTGGDAPGALQDLDAATRLDPKNAGLRSLKAQAHAAAGESDSAIVEAKRAVHLDDSNPDYRLQLGKLYAKAKEADRAVSELNEAIRLGLDTHEVRMALGETYLSEGLTVQAEEHFRAAAALAPRDLDSTLRLGQVYERSRPTEAEGLYRAYLAEAESPQVRIRLSGILVKKKAYGEALAELRLAAAQPGADFSDPESYAGFASANDYEVNDIVNQFRLTAYEYGEKQITREDLYKRSGSLLERSGRNRDLAEKVTPPQTLSAAHGHRRFAAELLVQAAIDFRTYIETDKAYTRDQHDLLLNEVVKEIAAARTAQQ